MLLESPDVTTEHSINLTDQPVQKAEEKDEKITLKRKPSKKLDSIDVEKVIVKQEEQPDEIQETQESFKLTKPKMKLESKF